jgi:hypothetical protein
LEKLIEQKENAADFYNLDGLRNAATDESQGINIVQIKKENAAVLKVKAVELYKSKKDKKNKDEVIHNNVYEDVSNKDIEEFANAFFNVNENTIASGGVSQDKTKEDIKAACEELIRDVTMSKDSVYDSIFWMFFYEDNPFVIAKVKLIVTLTAIVHVIFTIYYLRGVAKPTLPYYGSFSINLIRLITAMLLHM